jgi:hypothetical protein
MSSEFSPPAMQFPDALFRRISTRFMTHEISTCSLPVVVYSIIITKVMQY